MALEYRKRVDALFQAFGDNDMRLRASEDIRSLVGKIVVSPRDTERAELFLEGDLAGILTLAAGKKTPAHQDDERVLISLVAGARNQRYQQALFQMAAKQTKPVRWTGLAFYFCQRETI